MPEHSRRAARPTTTWERRLIRAARRGDPAAQARLLALYEPMVRRIARALYLPGADRDDLEQEARLGVIDAVRRWDPARGVPFSNFAWLCATREAKMAVSAALANKHRVLTAAHPLDVTRGVVDPFDGPGEVEVRSDRLVWRSIATLEAEQHRDGDPVAKTLARERLADIVRRARSLSSLERRALALATTDHSHREIATALGVRPRAVNNALQRARHKLRELEPIAA